MNSRTSTTAVLSSSEHAPRTLAWSKWTALAVLLILSSAGAARYSANRQDAEALRQRTAAHLPRSVITVHSTAGQALRRVVLPATLRGGTETQILARCNGYVSAWHKTIGDRVEKGELLAVIDVPELDQEMAQARAAVAQVKTRLDLARSTLKRWKVLSETDGATPQEYDEKRSAAQLAEADLAAAEANLRRLENLEQYRHIVAPFSGVITRRNIDVGNLITAGSQELFAITQTDPLRLTVQVPQAYADGVRAGQEVAVRFPETQGSVLLARIEHVAGALDPVTRSRQVDIALDNKEGKLLPGAYADVTLTLEGRSNTMIVPANVLIIEPEGPRVATVETESRIRFRDVKLGRDFGREVEVLEGIEPGDVLVASPSDLLVEGETVRTVEARQKEKEKTAALR